jgi:hypothetical protein
MRNMSQPIPLTEAAKSLGVSRTTLRTRMNAAGIPATTTGKGAGILPSDLAALSGKPTAQFAALGDPQSSRQELTTERATHLLMDLFMSTPTDPDTLLQELGLPRSTLRKMMLDDEIAQASETRLDGLLAIPWRIESGDTSQNDARVKHITDQLTPHVLDTVAASWTAVLYGYSVSEIIYSWSGGRYGINRIVEKPFEWFWPMHDGTLKYRPQGIGAPEIVDPFKFLLTRHRATFRNPYGEATLSRLYWPWCYRTHGWKYWINWLEKFGMPFLVGKASQGANVIDPHTGQTAVHAMMQSLSAAGRGSAIVVDAESSVDALNPTGNGDGFSQFDRAVSARIQKMILGQTLTSDVGSSGSYAAAQIHNLVREDKKRADLRLVTGTMNRLINQLWRLNGWTDAAPTFVMADDTGLETERAKRDAELAKAGIFKPTEQYLLDRYDFAPGDFTIPATPASPAKAPGAPGTLSALYSPGRSQKFTPGQQRLEDLADLALSQAGIALQANEIKAALTVADSPESFIESLAQTVFAERKSGQGDSLQQALDAALYAADILGYHNADKQQH